jgi:hypothetical protein
MYKTSTTHNGNKIKNVFIDGTWPYYWIGKLYFVDEYDETFVYTHDEHSVPGCGPEFWDKNKIIKILGVKNP